jgi:hypothetical protein
MSTVMPKNSPSVASRNSSMSFMFRRFLTGWFAAKTRGTQPLLPIDMVSKHLQPQAATMPGTTRQFADDSLLRPTNPARTVPYRARASIQSCRNVLLRQPRLIRGNQLSGLTDAEQGLSHLSSSLS